MNKIDLHIHSEYSSDGDLNVNAIIDRSKEKGIETISITDHNSVRGIEKAIDYGASQKVRVIPGIEIDCTFKKINLHVLGYFIDYKNEEYPRLEKDIYEKENEVAIERMTKLKNAIQVEVEIEKILKMNEGKIITGEAIAENVLSISDNMSHPLLQPYFDGGNRSDMPYVNFYWDFFSQGKIAYVPIEYISLKETISLIKETGGIPVIAHPGVYKLDKPEILDEIIQEGIEGIEVFSTYHSQEQAIKFLQMADQYQLLITCGSDFHGKYKPNIEIGSYTRANEDIDILSSLIKFY